MILSSFYSGLSGLQANSVALNVVGNNLANVNTSGFKRSQADFGQIMSNTIRGVSGAGNPTQIGLGVGVSQIVSKFEQGSIQTTGIKTQMAIQGEGFFQVNTNGTNQYTRSGNFAFNNEGSLVSHQGGHVQGYVGTTPDGTVDRSDGVQDIRIDFGRASPPKATTQVRFISNLSAEAEVGDTFPSSVEVFDSKGVAHNLTVTYTKDAIAGRWNYLFEFPDGTPDPTAGNQPDGFIEFDAAGNLTTIDGAPINVSPPPNRTIRFTGLTTGANDFNFTWQLVDEVNPTDPTQNAGYVTNYGNTSNTGTLFQDGFGSGVLQDIDFTQEGVMIGFFDNGLSLELGQIALATFNNQAGLKQVDGGFYLASEASGPASIDGEGTGGKGSIIASSLESSNVDIAEEFTSLIVHQRGYQSNSKTITTADQLLQEAINLKR